MSENRDDSDAPSPSARQVRAGQYPHIPGQDPRGSGKPRNTAASRWRTSATADESEHSSASDGERGPGQDAALGGDKITEDQLEADTAVEADALKSLDPDDTPA